MALRHASLPGTLAHALDPNGPLAHGGSIRTVATTTRPHPSTARSTARVETNHAHYDTTKVPIAVKPKRKAKIKGLESN